MNSGPIDGVQKGKVGGTGGAAKNLESLDYK